jgi:hypothetical protein
MSAANLGLLSAAAGDLENGRRLARLALDRGEAVDDGPGVGGALLNLAVVELFGGERRAARRFAEQAVAAFRPQGYLRLEAWACQLAAELARDAGDEEACRPVRSHGGRSLRRGRLSHRPGPVRRPPSGRAELQAVPVIAG